MGSPDARRRSSARAITARTSARPALTAEASSKAPRQAIAMILARVVFPEPGGPWKMAEWGSPLSTARPQRRPLAEQVLLPDQLVQRARPHPDRERGVRRGHASALA